MVSVQSTGHSEAERVELSSSLSATRLISALSCFWSREIHRERGLRAFNKPHPNSKSQDLKKRDNSSLNHFNISTVLNQLTAFNKGLNNFKCLELKIPRFNIQVPVESEFIAPNEVTSDILDCGLHNVTRLAVICFEYYYFYLKNLQC